MTEGFDIVFVEDYEVVMSIGIYDHEKANPQRVLISIKAQTAPNTAHNDDDISGALSYEVFVNAIETLSVSKHYDLVETFAEKLCAEIKSKSTEINNLQITIKKPDIFSSAKSAGITISRSF